MSLFLTIAFLFFIGSMAGWVIEVVFRRFFSSANPERKWINPGFLSGPYLPLYGSACAYCSCFRCWNNIYQSRIRRSGRRRCSP